MHFSSALPSGHQSYMLSECSLCRLCGPITLNSFSGRLPISTSLGSSSEVLSYSFV